MHLGQRGGTRLQLAGAVTWLGDDGVVQAQGAHLLADSAARAAPGDDEILNQVAVDAHLLAHLAAVDNAGADGAAPGSQAALQESALVAELVLLLTDGNALAAPVLDEHDGRAQARAEVEQLLAL